MIKVIQWPKLFEESDKGNAFLVFDAFIGLGIRKQCSQHSI